MNYQKLRYPCTMMIGSHGRKRLGRLGNITMSHFMNCKGFTSSTSSYAIMQILFFFKRWWCGYLLGLWIEFWFDMNKFFKEWVLKFHLDNYAFLIAWFTIKYSCIFWIFFIFNYYIWMGVNNAQSLEMIT